MATHTPAPWIAAHAGPTMRANSQPLAIAQRGEANLIAGVFGDVAGGPDVAKANADHIVRCVNAHADLVAVVRDAKEYLQHPGGEHMPARAWFDLNEKIREVLAQLERN